MSDGEPKKWKPILWSDLGEEQYYHISYFGYDYRNNREVHIVPVDNHKGRVIAVADGFTHDENGAKTIWRELLPFEQYEVDLSSVTKPPNA